MSIGRNIRRLRESYQLTQRELGAIAGVSDKAVSTWEKGIKEPRMGAIQRLADYFGIPKSALLDDEPPRQDPRFSATLDRLCAAWGRSPQIICRDTGLSPERLSLLQQGVTQPTDEELARLEGYFRVPFWYPPAQPETPNVTPVAPLPAPGRRIPVLGRVPAGVPVEAVTDVLEEIDLAPDLAADGYEYFALQVRGDSMIPEYREGDIVVVRIQPTAETGDDVIAYVGDSDATLKRLAHTADGIELHPLNPAYEVRRFSRAQVGALPVTIGGIVMEQRRRRH